MGEKNQPANAPKPQAYPPMNALGMFPEMYDFDLGWDDERPAPPAPETPTKEPDAA